MDNTKALSILNRLPAATLPVTYENARIALRTCVNFDECQSWADKAAALASYAKQSEDEELYKMARRIQVRAVDRCGQLLEEIEPDPGGRPSKTGRGAPTSLGRLAAAEEAGLSKDQAITALRVNRVPRDEFEGAVESDDPPTVTALARRGTAPKPKPPLDLAGRSPEDFQAAGELIGAVNGLRRYAEKLLSGQMLDSAARGLAEHERQQLVSDIYFLTTVFQLVVPKLLSGVSNAVQSHGSSSGNTDHNSNQVRRECTGGENPGLMDSSIDDQETSVPKKMEGCAL